MGRLLTARYWVQTQEIPSGLHDGRIVTTVCFFLFQIHHLLPGLEQTVISKFIIKELGPKLLL